MPGYNLATSDQNSIGTRYMCNSCNLLLRDAMQTGCGHFYCSSCLGNLFLNGTSKMTCLQDQTELLSNEVFPDNFMRREVQAFVVHCTFMDDGCKWKGEVRHLENHTNSCEFLKIPCVHPECGMLVKKDELSEHLEKDCECRLENCGFCKGKINHNKMKLHHERECPAYPVECDKCNKDGIPRAKLSEHQDPVVGDCDAVHGPCPFSQIGCPHTEVLSHSQKKKHLEQANTYHTILVLRYALRIGREMEALLMHNPRMMSRSPQLITNYDGVISDILAQVQTGTAENRDLRENLREHSERITSLERKLASGNLSAASPSAKATGDSGGSAQNPEITRRLINVENRTADHEVLLVQNNRTIEQANRNVATVRRQVDIFQETSRRLEQRIDSIEHTGNFSAATPSAQVAQGSVDSNNGLQNTEIIQRLINLENRTADREVLLAENYRTIDQETIRRLKRSIDSAVNRDSCEKCHENSERMNLLERELAARNFLPAAPSAQGSVMDMRGPPPVYVREENKRPKMQLASERQDHERPQEQWQAKQQLAAFKHDIDVEKRDRERALENEKRDREQQLEAQRNRCDSHHEECFAELQRAVDDREMENIPILNLMENLQSSIANLQERLEAQSNRCDSHHEECFAERQRAVDDGEMENIPILNLMENLQSSIANLQERVSRLEGRRRDSNM